MFNHAKDFTYDTPFVVVNKGALNLQIPPSFIPRLNYEVLKPETLINLADTYYELGPDGDNALGLINFTKESSLWL